MSVSIPCWEWPGKKTPQGYGYIVRAGKAVYVHRLSYETFIGPIPEGLQIDHLCRNRACARPDHLEAVTSKENVLRGEGPTAINARKKFCINGHPFDDENTYVNDRGRDCRACKRAARLKCESTPEGKAVKKARDKRRWSRPKSAAIHPPEQRRDTEEK